MNKIYFTIVILLLWVNSSHAQESLFESYLPIIEEAMETRDPEKLYAFKEQLSREQNNYLDMKYTVYRAKQNRSDDPCEDVRKDAIRGYNMGYSSLLFTAENDFNFFSECQLVEALRYNTNRSNEETLKGLEIIKRVAEQGNAQVQYNLAMEFGWYPAFKRMDLDEDINQYMKYMKMAAYQGYSDAHYRVALGYDQLKDFVTAKSWVEKALINHTDQSELADYRWDLAKRYEKGIGVEIDLTKALNFYKTAADLAAGVHLYQNSFTLGVWLYEGSGSFGRDRDLGLRYLRRAARSETLPSAEKYCEDRGISF